MAQERKQSKTERGGTGEEPQSPLNPFLEDEGVQQTVAEDPLFRFLIHWRWPLVIAALIVGGGYYVKQELGRSYTRGMQQAADVYYEVRKDFKQLDSLREQVERARGTDAAALDEAGQEKLSGLEQDLETTERRLSDRLRALSDSRAPYDVIAAAYTALLAVKQGSTADMEKALDALDWETGTTESSERFFSELTAVALARGLLNHEATVSKGRGTLEAIAEKGEFVGVSAALTLSRIAATSEDRQSALGMLERLSARDPLQTSLLAEEIERLKGFMDGEQG